ncbi:MAG: NAD(P)/FAD-dependent oxidoreductase [Gemmatimonadetes bacterium]|nr:NAD(P)/FAD-dependent oxidoreductase [Gemmatimonadota bacterium]NNF13896.1 NAD(P)/FAD-dependent oxidoreductase [Gemmatimonadota bacterium]NNL31118.1 NAD(P)/FAD-dependent oxidoreductase [Gemmatimonadota bacterium]
MTLDAVIVGAGPNGLAAAVELARNGLDVLVLEAESTVGGSARTEELTLPGFRHDVGSAVYPLGIASPFFSSLPLEEHGLEWVHPDVPLAHPLDGQRAALLKRGLDETAADLRGDEASYRGLVSPFCRRWDAFRRHVLDAPTRIPRSPLLMLRFGLLAMRSTPSLADRFRTQEARALLAGNAAHAGIPLERPLASAVGLTLMVAGHTVGWPFARGGAGSITAALASLLRSLGGKIETDSRVTSLSDLPAARATLLALTHQQVAELAEDPLPTGGRLPAGYRDMLRTWEYGPGAFKLDWALDGPIPWTDAEVARAGTVHLGGTLEEIALAERAPWKGTVADRPFVLLAQPSLFDPTRAPEGKHVAWAYCHVPNGWTGDATTLIEAQVERYAPGFRDRILARSVLGTADLEGWNANLVGGDVNGGAFTLSQTFGPMRSALRPWGTPVDGLYVCSASRPPGGGVHGMAGYHAARDALKRTFGLA